MITKELLSQLNDRQQFFLTWIYNECVNNHWITKSNIDISKVVNIPESTVEKYLKLLDQLHLIVRSSERVQDFLTREWRTASRKITLNPKAFDPKLIAMERDHRIKSLLDLIDSSDFMQAQASHIMEKRGLNTG